MDASRFSTSAWRSSSAPTCRAMPPRPITIDGAQLGPIAGTAVYMSPEQARGLRADHRSDIFSLGSVLYEMLAGFPPFRRSTMADTLSAILNEEPRELTSIVHIPPALERVVQHCLEKKTENRCQNVRDLMFDLEALPTTTSTATASSRGRASTFQNERAGDCRAARRLRRRGARIPRSSARGVAFRVRRALQRAPADGNPRPRGVSIALPGWTIRHVHGQRERNAPDFRAPSRWRPAAGDHQEFNRPSAAPMVTGWELAPVLLARSAG